MYEIKTTSLSFVLACIIQLAVSETYESPDQTAEMSRLYLIVQILWVMIYYTIDLT